MAQLPLPQRGQPIQYSDIYNIVDTVNTINSSLVVKTSDSVFTGNDGVTQTQKTSQLLVAAVYKDQAVFGSVDSSTPQTVTVPFGVTFKSPPVVTVTPVANNSHKASLNTTATVVSTTTSYANIIIQFGVSGSGASVGLNVIAVGVSSVN